MKIQIANYLMCSHVLECEPNRWDVIAILDSNIRESKYVHRNAKQAIQLHFDDIVKSTAGKTLPSREHIQKALDFGSHHENLIVSCRAGQSRSAALAFAIAFQVAGPETAFRILNPKRHSPNELVLQIADELVDRDGLFSSFESWRNEFPNVHPIQFLDEIEREQSQLESLGARDQISKIP